MGKGIRAAFAAAMAMSLAGLTAAPAVAADDDPDFLTASLGGFGMRKEDTMSAEFLAQYRSDYKLWIFKPHAGVMATSEGSFYGFAGVLIDFYVGNRWVITPSTAIGYYYEGDGLDLGHAAEFRSGLEVAYRFDDRSRLGLGIYHMSNLVFGEKNPGAESVTLNYSIPLTSLLSR